MQTKFPSVVPDSDSIEVLVLSVSHQCSSLQAVAVLLMPCWPVCWSHFVSVCCLCAMATAQGSQRSQLSEGTTCRIALGCLPLNFVSPGLCPEKKAVAVVESTKGDSISCVLMRGQLCLVPSGALPWCNTSLQNCRSLSTEVQISAVACYVCVLVPTSIYYS